MANGEKKAPTVRFDAGLVSLAKFENTVTTKDGSSRVIPSYDLTRAYEGEGGKWQHTRSLQISDLPKASAVLRRAYDDAVVKKKDVPQTQHPPEPEADEEPSEA